MIDGQRIVLTGLTGRLGGALAKALVPHNQVYGLARYTQINSLEFWRSSGVHAVVCDLATGDFKGTPEEIDYVLHCAAWTGEGGAHNDADYAIRQNAEATALLMARYRRAKAFLHVSTMGVYHPDPPRGGYRETDPLGPGPAAINYTASKLAAEGAVRALCRIVGVPTLICRVTCPYGNSGLGGLPKTLVLDPLVRAEPIIVAEDGEKLRSPIHNDDVIGFLGPLLASASVPATIVNCGGDEPVSIEMMARHMGTLLGMEPRFEVRRPYPWPHGHLNPSKRIGMTGPCRVHWREGMRRLSEHYYPALAIRPSS
jgi:UDP-glucuronate 4-epimerase